MFKFHQRTNWQRNYEKYLRLLMVATATKTWKSLNERFSVKSSCSDIVFYDTVVNADIESLKYHVAIEPQAIAKFENYRLIRTTWNFELFDKIASTIFNKASTPFWKLHFELQNSREAMHEYIISCLRGHNWMHFAIGHIVLFPWIQISLS